MKNRGQYTVDVVALFCVGASLAAYQPFQSLFAVNNLGLSEGGFSSIQFIGAVVNMVVALILGSFVDANGKAKQVVLITVLAGIISFSTIYVFDNALVYIAMSVVFIPVFMACYGLMLSSIRTRYVVESSEGVEQQFVSLARSFFTFSWILTPLSVSFLLAAGFELKVIFLVSGLTSAVTFLLVWTTPVQLEAHNLVQTRSSDSWKQSIAQIFNDKVVLKKICGAGLLQTAHVLNGILLPLFLVQNLSATTADVGRVSGLVAAAEVPSMFAITWLLRKIELANLLAIGGIVFSGYFLVVGFSRSIADVYFLVPLNAIGAAIILNLSIGFLQEAIKGKISLSTSLISVVFVFGNALSAVILSIGGYFSIENRFLLLCAAPLCVIGALLVFHLAKSQLAAR
jgi:MFS transporter, SET family, sugar efflux transporter